MKITKIETIHVLPRWLFLKMYTDEGFVGYGEPIVEGRAKTVEMAVKSLKNILSAKIPSRLSTIDKPCIGEHSIVEDPFSQAL